MSKIAVWDLKYLILWHERVARHTRSMTYESVLRCIRSHSEWGITFATKLRITSRVLTIDWWCEVSDSGWTSQRRTECQVPKCNTCIRVICIRCSSSTEWRKSRWGCRIHHTCLSIIHSKCFTEDMVWIRVTLWCHNTDLCRLITTSHYSQRWYTDEWSHLRTYHKWMLSISRWCKTECNKHHNNRGIHNNNSNRCSSKCINQWHNNSLCKMLCKPPCHHHWNRYNNSSKFRKTCLRQSIEQLKSRCKLNGLKLRTHSTQTSHRHECQ